MDIRKVKSITDLISYFSKNLNWDIDMDDFDDIEDVTYDFAASDIGLKDESFAKISALRQLQPLVDGQKWGIFCVEFDSNRFEPSALKKILSGLIPRKRNSADHAVWEQQDLLFICNWGNGNNSTIGLAHFEDREGGLPQIKMFSCAPALEDFTQINQFEQRLSLLAWPKDTSNISKWRETWSSAFTMAYHQTIRDSSTLTIQLAAEAQNIQQRILEVMNVETENGYVHKLYQKFKDTLINDMTEKQFADMYAQTVVYGLFSARCMDPSQNDFSAEEAVECIPNTNPFLKSLMKECFGIENTSALSFDELEIGNVVDLLTHTKTDEIIKDFNRQTGGGKEDPVIHFYEEFLTAYDKAQKVQRGVYYTPQPVVNFMVRAVDDIIKKEFGYEDGLATTATKKIKVKTMSAKKINGFYREVERLEEVPAIQVLDPATGTGTFVRQIILQIYENFCEKHKTMRKELLKQEWCRYVDEHLLSRINAFELMMAPYSVAHMKLAMTLKDTGYDFSGKHRLNVFLCNALEKPGDSEFAISLFDDPLALESIDANRSKKNQGINVLIGNPPYSGESSNKGAWISKLMDEYKKEPGGEIKLQEKNPKWLNDDYVKFIRFAENIIQQTSFGILAYICPHGFLDNPTFRGMRWHLLDRFSKVYVINLHGNINRKEKSPLGGKDENVFDIQQGVSINLFVKTAHPDKKMAEILSYDVWGERKEKYDFLNQANLSEIEFTKIEAIGPEFNFTNTDLNLKKEYLKGFSVAEFFKLYSVGVVTAKDKILINSNKENLLENIKSFYGINPDIEKIKLINYRPFDKRFIYYDPALLERSREGVMKHFFKENIGLITARSNKGDDCSQFLVSDVMSEAKCGERTTQSAIFPLYVYENSFGEIIKVPNINVNIVHEIEKCINEKVPVSEMNQFIYLVFCYIYAVLYSNNYRKKFKEFINNDFPRVPFPENKDEFYKLSSLGKKLITIHLSNPRGVDSEKDANVLFVEKISFKNETVYINNEKLINISNENWNYTMCGYQPLQKWFKDRKGQNITRTEVQELLSINEIITQTISIQNEIDFILP